MQTIDPGKRAWRVRYLDEGKHRCTRFVNGDSAEDAIRVAGVDNVESVVEVDPVSCFELRVEGCLDLRGVQLPLRMA